MRSTRLLTSLVCTTLCFALGCGDSDESTPPAVSSPAIACDAAPAGSFADGQVVREVSIKVSDADRDLVAVKANLNGIELGQLTDDDGDSTFNWTPPSSLDPIRCQGTFSLRVEALDAQDNMTVFEGTVEK